MDIKKQLQKMHLSGDYLKIIACIIMTMDHAGFCLVHYYMSVFHMDILPETYTKLNTIYTSMRAVGRIAFPIFCFFIVEGFIHTRNIYKYALRLAIFAIISEIPFDLAHYHQIIYLEHQNTLFSMFIGLCLLITIKYISDPARGYSPSTRLITITCATLGFMELASLIHVDYGYHGILLIAILYITREIKELRLITGAAFTAWEAHGPIAYILLYFYDPAVKPKMKYFFYIFYPAHLMLLYLISLLF